LQYFTLLLSALTNFLEKLGEPTHQYEDGSSSIGTFLVTRPSLSGKPTTQPATPGEPTQVETDS